MFIDKLNKKQEGVYVLEEEKNIQDGKWEGYLNHDNVNSDTIYIYTEEKFGGDRVENYFISTSEEMPWKLYLKVFSKSEKIYITYESTGDQVEAEDVNLVQDAIMLQDTKVTSLVAETLRLENVKSDLVYVDTELLKKYDKDKVYTKEEVTQLIDNLIGGSPEALDTLKEIADALNNDPNFAATMTTELSKKVDKIVGKSLSDENYALSEKQKLAGIEKDANNYIHPANHSADMITENSNKRFVSDVEKTKWDNMEAGDISDLAGEGRTTETVKGNTDNIDNLKTEVDEIEIGGRNILKNSSAGIYLTESDRPTGRTHEVLGNGNGLITVTNEKIKLSAYLFIVPSYVDRDIAKESGSFTFSMNVKTSTDKFHMQVRCRHGNNNIVEGNANIPNTDGSWMRVFATMKVPNDKLHRSNISLDIFGELMPVGSTIEYKNFKLERGNKATDWTPNPEDLAGDIKQVMDKANQAFQSASDGKKLIATAVAGKGGTANGSDTFLQLASSIGKISTGQGTASGTLTDADSSDTISGLSFEPAVVAMTSYTMRYSASGKKETFVTHFIINDEKLGVSISTWFYKSLVARRNTSDGEFERSNIEYSAGRIAKDSFDYDLGGGLNHLIKWQAWE